MSGAESVATSFREQRKRRRLPTSSVFLAWIILEGTIISYAGVLALWSYRDAAAQSPAGLASHYGAVVLLSVLMVAALQHGRAYRFVSARRMECIRRALTVWLFTVAGLVVAASALALDRHFVGCWAVFWLGSATAGLVVERCIVTLWLSQLKKKELVRHRVVIVPALERGLLLERRLEASGELGLELLGFADDRRSLPARFPRDRLIGDNQKLLKMIRDGEVDEVVIALPWSAAASIQRLLRMLTETAVRVSLATGPAIYELPNQQVEELGGIPVVRLADRPIRGLGGVLKRLEDIVLASLLLLLTLPLLLIVAMAIKLDSPGPILFRQPRVGFNDRPFEVLKFRTMYAGVTDIVGERQAIRKDPRVTRIGAWLRRTSIDELPQLVNVLKGEMSLVGPRPHAHGTTVEGRLFNEAVSRYAARHRVKPGITGWAQVNGWRGETEVMLKLEERLRHDLYYVENWSVWLDFVILARTLFVPIRDRNAY
jgi:polysaccharide biosynthesis protein PslA